MELKTIYVVGRQPVSVRHIPKLMGECRLISCYEVIRRTEKGYRLKVNYSSIDSLAFSLTDIVSDLNVPRLSSLNVELVDA